jgi:hypothetical protein
MPVQERIMQSNVTFINMTAAEFNRSSPDRKLQSCDISSDDVTQLIIVVCLGVLLPTVIVVVLTCVLTAFRRYRHNVGVGMTAIALPSETFPPETVNNRLHASHNKKLFMNEGECDVTAPINSCPGPAALTVVNIISDVRDRVGGPRTSHVKLASNRPTRMRSDATVFGRSNLRDQSEDNSIVCEALEIADADRSFKNARTAAKNNVYGVTIGSVNEYRDVTDLHFSRRRGEEQHNINVSSNSVTNVAITECLLSHVDVVVDDWSAKSRFPEDTVKS